MLGYWVFSVCYKGTFIVKCMTIKRFAGEIFQIFSYMHTELQLRTGISMLILR